MLFLKTPPHLAGRRINRDGRAGAGIVARTPDADIIGTRGIGGDIDRAAGFIQRHMPPAAHAHQIPASRAPQLSPPASFAAGITRAVQTSLPVRKPLAWGSAGWAGGGRKPVAPMVMIRFL